jgi:hypothetical protein
MWPMTAASRRLRTNIVQDHLWEGDAEAHQLDQPPTASGEH